MGFGTKGHRSRGVRLGGLVDGEQGHQQSRRLAQSTDLQDETTAFHTFGNQGVSRKPEIQMGQLEHCRVLYDSWRHTLLSASVGQKPKSGAKHR